MGELELPLMRRTRVPVVILLIASLLLADVTRRWADAARRSNNVMTGANVASLSRMNSFALALLLGGLRGPLVMILWPSAEQQKSSRNLEDFDTKIEWIRLLQAEFDSVHLFQIWNKAYNVSVQLANVANKYLTILDALDYAHSVDAERPNDINIIEQIGQIYADKLGNSAERAYYDQRVRDETKARQPMMRVVMPESDRQKFSDLATSLGLPAPRLHFTQVESSQNIAVTIPKAVADAIQKSLSGPEISYTERAIPNFSHDDPRWKRRGLDPMLDDKGMLLPELYAPKLARPADLPANSEWNDGSELQYLKQFEPFPYGIPARAIGFNYYKRAQVLATVNHQKHINMNTPILASRAALALEDWAKNELEYGRRAEIESLGMAVPAERLDMEPVTAAAALDAKILYPSLMEEAIWEYNRADNLVDTTVTEFEKHIESERRDFSTYISHIEELRAQQLLARGDRDFCKLMTSPAADREALKKAAIHSYEQAVISYVVVGVRYWAPEEVVSQILPPGVNKANVDKAPLNLADVNKWVDAEMKIVDADPLHISGSDELTEFFKYISRARDRLQTLAK